MKILVFGAYYTPEIAASMYLAEDLFSGMATFGHFVNLYVPSPSRGISRDVRKKYKKIKKEILFDGHLVIHRFSLFREGKNNLLRALRYVFLNLAFIWKGLFVKADVIFVQSTPPTQGLVAGILKFFKKIPVIYNLQDIFPDSLVNAGMTHTGSFIWKIGRKIENYTYRHADKIIVISNDFKANIVAKGVPENKIVVVPNWPDCTGVYPIERKDNILFDKYNLDRNKFYISYCGNIGYSQNVDLLLDVAKEINIELPDLSFVIIGDGVAKESVESRVRNENINNIILLPFQPYKDIAHVFSLSDAGLIMSRPCISKSSVPSKAWNIMAAERPILASFDSNSDLSILINEIKCGLTAEAGNKEQFVNMIKEIYSHNNSNMGRRGRKFLLENLDKNKCVNIYINTINQTKE